MAIPESASYDLIAIGSGPAGMAAAVEAAQLGKRAAVIERAPVVGGASTNTGTVPSKTMRAAIAELTGRAAGVYGRGRAGREIAIDDVLWRTQQVIEHERELVCERLRRNGVRLIEGAASFADPWTLELRTGDGCRRLRAERVVIAVGSTPARPPGFEFDDATVIDTDGIPRLQSLPRTLTVVGGGVSGLEYASMAAALGIRATLVEQRDGVLDFVDDEICAALQYHLRGLGLVFRLGERVEAVRPAEGGGAVAYLASGEQVQSDVVISATGRRGATGDLNLVAAGLESDASGRIAVGPDGRTAQPSIFAAGDVTGFPSLAGTSLEQGRRAALAAFGESDGACPQALPHGIYTIPEISFAGPGEQELADAAIPYTVGRAPYRVLSRGEIAGDRAGLLKLLVHAETRRVLAVHIFGTAATELVHIGQTAIAGGLTADYFANAIFNVPTFSEAYATAARDAVSRLAEPGGTRGRTA